MGQTLEIGFWPMGSITVSKGYATGPHWSGNALGILGQGSQLFLANMVGMQKELPFSSSAARAHKCRAVHTALPLKINLPSTSLPAKSPGRLERDYTTWL